MIDFVKNELANNGISELIYLLAGSFILYILQIFGKTLKREWHRRKIRSEIESCKERENSINVIDLANGDPEFEKRNIFSREVSKFGQYHSLYLEFPEDLNEQLLQTQRDAGYVDSQLTSFQKDTSFDGGNTFIDLAEMTQISNLPELIEKHKRIVGKEFLRSENGLIFNGEKYGVFNLRFTRFGEEESPGVEIDLFRTDYFTHRVFRSIYHDLKRQNHEITQADQSNFLKYRPFFTSFGINTLLICEGSNSKEIILSKRSNRVHGAKSRFHVTMNEGLSRTDRDPFGKVDLELCFKRGLLEELGINENVYQLAVKSAFYDFFLEKNNLEIGVSSVLELEVEYMTDLKPLIARDKHLETDAFVSLPMKAKNIGEFIKRNEFVPHGLYVIERVLLREGINLRKV